MLMVADAPSIAPDAPSLAFDKFNLSVAGIFVSAGPASVPVPNWPAVALGDLLLAKERGLESWHECEVVEVDGDLVTLVWSGLSDSEVFTRRLWQLGTIHLRGMKSC